jgi:hypothetical protein
MNSTPLIAPHELEKQRHVATLRDHVERYVGLSQRLRTENITYRDKRWIKSALRRTKLYIVATSLRIFAPDAPPEIHDELNTFHPANITNNLSEDAPIRHKKPR